MSKPSSNHPWRTHKRRWTHNVQIIRLSFPPFLNNAHHEKLVALHHDLRDLLAKHDLPSEPSYLGFYRADADWDNVDSDSCVNYPDRGTRDSEIDNAP